VLTLLQFLFLVSTTKHGLTWTSCTRRCSTRSKRSRSGMTLWKRLRQNSLSCSR
jgi:hypothetical protein